jgi:hypothetical protein
LCHYRYSSKNCRDVHINQCQGLLSDLVIAFPLLPPPLYLSLAVSPPTPPSESPQVIRRRDRRDRRRRGGSLPCAAAALPGGGASTSESLPGGGASTSESLPGGGASASESRLGDTPGPPAAGSSGLRLLVRRRKRQRRGGRGRPGGGPALHGAQLRVARLVLPPGPLLLVPGTTSISSGASSLAGRHRLVGRLWRADSDGLRPHDAPVHVGGGIAGRFAVARRRAPPRPPSLWGGWWTRSGVPGRVEPGGPGRARGPVARGRRRRRGRGGGGAGAGAGVPRGGMKRCCWLCFVHACARGTSPLAVSRFHCL